MKVRFISQASVIIKCSDCTIWTDPWLEGKAFNNSWSLHPKPDFNDEWYNEIDYIWISHEHPDHFHIQTLKNLPQKFKENVTILFQDKKSDKMPNAFKMLGFKKIKLFTHAKLTKLTPETDIFVYQIGMLDSSIGVINNAQTLFNLNDCEPNSQDYKIISKKFSPKIDILLNQFSLAGNNGSRKNIPLIKEKAIGVLNSMIYDHVKLNAKYSIPFASFIYFSSITNKYINKYHNKITDVVDRFKEKNLELKILYINDVFDLDNPNLNNDEAVKKYNEIQSDFDLLEYDSYPVIPFETIKEKFTERVEQLKKHYPKFILNKMGTMTAYIEDLNYAVTFSVRDKTFVKTDHLNIDDTDLIIYSQPLMQAFSTTWGVQTLGVGAQYFIEKNQNTWKWYRLITNMNNSQIYLKPQYLFSSKMLKYIFERVRKNGISQLIFRLKKQH